MPDDVIVGQSTEQVTGQENKKEDQKSGSDATTEMMLQIMKRLDSIEQKASQKNEPIQTPEPKKDDKSLLEEVKQLISKQNEENFGKFQNFMQETALKQQLDDLIANVPEENRQQAEMIKKYVKNPAEAIKEIMEAKLTVPKVIDYRTAINSGMSEAEFLASTGLMKNMGLTAENLGVNFNDIVTMVQSRKLMDGKNVVRTVFDMVKNKFKL